ncbi:MAG: NAD(P)H-dependent oxidoreductase [Gammaproteobacteria bacterium]|nr:NAD(P)H-dependent oxidoreductase [Gammaproteobacteria bacterium]
MKILAFAASNSRKSINQQLVRYAAGLVAGAEVEMLDLNDYEMPLFSEDREAEIGQPDQARAIINKIADSDAVMIAFAEHNGSYSAAYKNIFDWASRIHQQVFQNKPMVLLATSPGPGGAATVLTTATTSAPYFAGDVKASLSVPSFYDNFDMEQGRISNDAINQQLIEAVNRLRDDNTATLQQAS